MAAGLNFCSSHGSGYKVRECTWDGERDSSSEDGGGGGGGVTYDTQTMEVKGQLIPVSDHLTCADRKQRERMAELQERRRSLQALLSVRLAELRRVCLQEAELTGAVPRDFPLEAGEKPPSVRRRGGASRQPNRKCRAEEDEAQRSKPKKTLFSGALRKHNDSNAHTQTHTHHGKRTVHRGCHTDDTVRSESSSTSDSTGHDNDEGVSQCRPPLVPAGSPVEVFGQSKPRRNSVLNRSDPPDPLQIQRPAPALLQAPPPPRSQDSSPSSEGGGGARAASARRSNSSDGLLDRPPALEEEAGLWVNGGGEGRGRAGDGGGEGAGRGRGGGYSEVLLDYIWGKQQQQLHQQLQRQQQQPPARQPVSSHPLYNGYPPQLPPPPPPNYHPRPPADQRRVKVTRTKSCGPFLPVQQSQPDADAAAPPPAIQPDPHPHLLPPRPPQLPPTQDAQLEEATRSLHKALALEGLRDWYLRNTVGVSPANQSNGKVSGGVKGQAGVLQRRRTTHGVLQPPSYRAEASHHKQTALPHSATFHGHPLHGRSADAPLYRDSFLPQKADAASREASAEPPSPGTLV